MSQAGSSRGEVREHALGAWVRGHRTYGAPWGIRGAWRGYHAAVLDGGWADGKYSRVDWQWLWMPTVLVF